MYFGLSDGKKIAVDTLSPSNGKQIDLILVFDISTCTNTTPCPPRILPGTPQPLPGATPVPNSAPPLLDNFPGFTLYHERLWDWWWTEYDHSIL